MRSRVQSSSRALSKSIDKFQKLANSRSFDKAINLIDLALTIHGNAMLSKDLGESFLYVFSNILASIGIKDDEGNHA